VEDKQQNRKKQRRARGEGVTSYRVTSSLTLTEEATERVNQPKPPPQQQYSNPYYEQGFDPNYPAEAQPTALGYYDANGQWQEGADPSQSYDPQGYYDANGQWQQGADPNQGYYDPNQAQGYYDANGQWQQGADPNQSYYDPNQAQGYYDANGQWQQGTDPNQGYYDPNQAQGYYDANGQWQQGADPNQGYYDSNQAQGYYDANGQWQQGADPNQGYYDPNQAQGYYDANGQWQQGADPNQGYYDNQAQGYYDANGQWQTQPQGYAQEQQPAYYAAQDGNNYAYHVPQQPAPEPAPKKRKKPKTVLEAYQQMLGEGDMIASDASDSPHYIATQHHLQPLHPYGEPPPDYMLPQNQLIMLLGPIAKYYLLIKEKISFFINKMTSYTDMALELSEQIQKELKEATNLAFKGLMDQMRQKSPLAAYSPYPAYAGGPGAPPMYTPPPQDHPKVSFVDLHELNVEFTDNYDQPLYDFKRFANSQYSVSKMIVDPQSTEAALYAIRECAARAGAIPPATEGPYAHMPLTDVMVNISEDDLQAFLRYVKTYPGNYVARSLKISETFATWVVYGAPGS
jgi:hypothetical protein